MVDVTPGRVATQFKATWAGGRPICLDTPSSTFRISQFLSLNLASVGFPEPLVLSRRPSPVPSFPSRLYLPARKPLANGLQGQMPSPRDRKSTRLNSSHANNSYAVF